MGQTIAFCRLSNAIERCMAVFYDEMHIFTKRSVDFTNLFAEYRLVGQETAGRNRVPGSVGATLAAALVLAAVIGVANALAIRAQSPAGGPQSASAESVSASAFDVASVKVNADPDRQRKFGAIQYSPDTLTVRGLSLWLIMRWAYGVESFQMSGPDWMQGSPYYDIVAKAPRAVPKSQLRLMLRTLLADRFHLTVHRQKKEMSITALLGAKGGPRLRQSAGKYRPEFGAEAPMQFLGFDNDVHIQRSLDHSDGRIRDSFTNVPMTLFASVLGLVGSRTPYEKVPVVDMTGLQGRFDFVLVLDRPGDARPGDARPGDARSEGEGASLPDDPLAAYKRILPKELGLTLEPRKALVDVIVVDHADKEPAPN